MKIIDGLITTEQNGKDCHVGYIMIFQGQSFAPSGKLDNLTEEQVKTHNTTLSQAEIKGLEQCPINHGGTFYFIHEKVMTFMGDVVSTQVSLSPSKKQITFIFKGKTFSGKLQRDADCFNFKRIR